MTYYDVLGVPADASHDAIRRAYVALARRYHPDFHTTSDPSVRAANERAMQAVNEAWAVLSDPAARQRYDRSLQAGEPGGRTAGGGARRSAGVGYSGEDEFRPYDDGDDDIDPRLFDDDAANVVVTRRKQIVMVLPTLTFFAGVGMVLVGLVINVLALSALGLAAILLASLAFVVLPLLALSASARNDRR